MPNSIILDPPLKSSSRNGRKVTTITIHATAGASAQSSIAHLKLPSTKASYHYIIDRNGDRYKCVAVGRKAWHAGISVGPEGSDVNPYSIGIAFANRNNGTEQITPAQLTALKVLVDELMVAMPEIKWITTHFGISFPRKTDPRLFDLRKFVQSLPGAIKPIPWFKPASPEIT